MPRRREVPKRPVTPDPKFQSVALTKFVNVIMESGKKATAEKRGNAVKKREDVHRMAEANKAFSHYRW